jgi:microcystin-dependent protein
MVDEFIESAKTTDKSKEKVNNMVTNMNINDLQSRVLLDAGTTGTSLMSSSWAQNHNLTTKELPTPITIHMAAKGSETNASRFAWAPVEIKPGNLGKERTKTLIVAVISYDVILGMPFLQEHHVILNTADSTAHFPKHDVTIQCTTRQAKTFATSSATFATKQVQTEATSYATESEEIPPFDKMFPKVFQNKEPEGLPPLRQGCNHIIRIDEEKLR